MTDESGSIEEAVPQQREEPKNWVKARDDHEPVGVDSVLTPGKFTLHGGDEASWVKPGAEFGFKELRTHIEPWLTALFQSEHLSLLVGSGLTQAVHRIAKNEGVAGMSGDISTGQLRDIINAAAKKSAEDAKRKTCNIEDRIRVANELLRGFEIFGSTFETINLSTHAAQLRTDLTTAMREFAGQILASEFGIVTATNYEEETRRERAFSAIITFLMSFASRTGTRDRLHIFTTNYDRVIEAGSELAGLHLLDRFVGTLMPIFRSSRLDLDMHYNPPGIRGEPRYLEGVARFTKLHGSVDWVYTGDAIRRDIRRIGLPFGADSVDAYLKVPGLIGVDASRLMIYPNAAKDRETAEYPYVELFRDFAAAICRPNSTVVTYGYGFGDEHINRVIEDMLTIPSTHLVVISWDDAYERILPLVRTHHAQTTLLLGQDLANLGTLTEHFLPKPAIDRTTYRMTELLRHRYSSSIQSDQGDDDKNRKNPSMDAHNADPF